MQPQLLKPQQVSDWLESPVTRHFKELLIEHVEANKSALTNIILSGKVIRDLGEELAQIRGQLYALELVNELEFFLKERTENDKDLQTSKTMPDSED